MSIVTSILQCLYPSLCRSCNALITPDAIFCSPCASTIKPIVSALLPISKHQTLTVFAVSNYVNPVKTLVAGKFSGDLLASRQLAQLMLSNTPIQELAYDYIVSVPLHWTRYASRGFNQAYTMAKVIGKARNIPVASLVCRTRKTQFQWSLPAAIRQENVKNAFDISFRYKLTGVDFLKDKRILLVDDLCTTGATLKQVAKVLLRYQPASLTAVVGCRAV